MIPIGQTEAVQAGLANRTAAQAPISAAEAELREVAQKLEASFLAEMLKHAGVGENRSDFSGGEGEDQFASFLRQAQAEHIAKGGGIGLAEQLFQALKEKNGGIV